MFLSTEAPLGHKRVGAVIYGVGAIGSEVVKYALTKEWLQIVGAIDYDKSKVGRDLGEVVGLGRNIGIAVSDDAGGLFQRVKADVVILTTGSFFPSIYKQLEMAVQAGLRVVTTAEELAFPSLQNPELAKRLDEVAKGKSVSIMAVGINPGFVMDSLVVYLAAACLEVKRVRVKRVVNSSLRRKQLQLKVGAGLGLEEFRTNLGKTIFGHVGLLESAALVADGINMRPDKISQSIEPIVAESGASTEYVDVKAGEVAGMRQVARCFKGGNEYVELEVQFYVDAPDTRDEIFIEGEPNVNVTIKDGIFGDQATVAILIHSIPTVLNAKPGLLTPTGKSLAETFWQCPVELGY
jgi:4-hydroxy-tetrahydrodipicolinate reductase